MLLMVRRFKSIVDAKHIVIKDMISTELREDSRHYNSIVVSFKFVLLGHTAVFLKKLLC